MLFRSVVAVDGRLERADHCCQRLDCHLDPGAETTGCSEKNLVDSHGPSVWPMTPQNRPYRPPFRGGGPSLERMSAPRVITVEPESPAARAGLLVGDELLSIEGEQPRDILEYRTLVDGSEIAFVIERNSMTLDVDVAKNPSEDRKSVV